MILLSTLIPLFFNLSLADTKREASERELKLKLNTPENILINPVGSFIAGFISTVIAGTKNEYLNQLTIQFKCKDDERLPTEIPLKFQTIKWEFENLDGSKIEGETQTDPKGFGAIVFKSKSDQTGKSINLLYRDKRYKSVFSSGPFTFYVSISECKSK